MNNNLNQKNMKKTIFEGTVNGEKFNTVQEYNARLTELINSGVAVNASSNTRVEEVDEPAPTSGFVRTCTDEVCDEGKCTFTSTYDEDLSYYPYCEDDDIYYLDALVTNDSNINNDARKEMRNIFDKCYPYICESLYDENVSVDTKKTYLADIREIINRLKQDARCNNDALVNIRNNFITAEAEFKAAERKFNETIDTLNKEEIVLNDAKPVIEDFVQFYTAVEAETIQAIAEDNAKLHNKRIYECEKNMDKTKPTTTVTETIPQQMFDLQSVLDRVFGRSRMF
jgi:hypothetical protein